MTIQVETGIPAPLEARHGQREYPIVEMDVGQSFLVPNGNPNSIAASACRFGRQLGRKYRTAKVQGGVRVWRTA